ncbi:MAG: 50S ribosomal protein L4 [Dehalococcoidia bacterium]
MKLAVMNADGKQLRQLDVDDSVFGITPHAAVLHQTYTTQRNNQRWGTAHTKTRGEVVGSTRKVHRQKGTGKARAGPENSPTRVGGGTAFGPRFRDYSQSLPKKMRRLAIRSALSGKAADGQLVVIDQLAFTSPKTKEMIRILRNVGINRSALIVTGESDSSVKASARNLEKTKVLPARYLNVADMLNHQGLLMTEEAIRIAESLWAVKVAVKIVATKAEPRRSVAPKPEKAEEAPAVAAEDAEAKPGRRTRFVPKADGEAAPEKPARKPRTAKAEVATEAKPPRKPRTAKAEAATEAKPPRKPRTVKAEAGAEAKPARKPRTVKAEAGAEAEPARKPRAPKAEASITKDKPKPATRSRAKAADKPTDEAPKPRRRTTKKIEESEGPSDG